jgi:hypothetical protein
VLNVNFIMLLVLKMLGLANIVLLCVLLALCCLLLIWC